MRELHERNVKAMKKAHSENAAVENRLKAEASLFGTHKVGSSLLFDVLSLPCYRP